MHLNVHWTKSHQMALNQFAFALFTLWLLKANSITDYENCIVQAHDNMKVYLEIYAFYHRHRTGGAGGSIASPHFRSQLGTCFIKIPAAIKANLQQVLQVYAISRLERNAHNQPPTHLIAIILLVGLTAGQLIILCRFQHPHFQVGYYSLSIMDTIVAFFCVYG